MTSLIRISSGSAVPAALTNFASKPLMFCLKFSIKKSFGPTAASILIAKGATNCKPHIACSFIGFPSTFNYTINNFHQKLYFQQSLRNFSTLPNASQTKIVATPINHNVLGNRRNISSRRISKNMTLLTHEPLKSEIDPITLEIKTPTGNPLVVMMAWLMAKQKHLRKYAEIYTNLGYDVVIVYITPWQILWPVKGTQLVAAETLKFLENNSSYASIVLHGFSAGAYQFGEMMLMMKRDLNRYQQILDRMISQVWDSAADITEFPIGVSQSLFPNHQGMQKALFNYTKYHLKTFHNQATIHYMRSSHMFHFTLLKVPALILVSKDDAMGPEKSNRAYSEKWEKNNIKVTFKCWEKSAHVSHYMKHKEEYLSLLYKHLEETGALEMENIKSRENIEARIS